MNPREQIIEVGKELFKRYGFKKTSMNDIANGVHKSKSSIYHYFRSKEEIFIAIAEDELLDLKKALYEAIKKADSTELKLRAYILTRQEGYARLTSLYEALYNDILEDLILIEHIRNRFMKEEYNTIKMILRRDIKKNIIIIDPDTLIRSILAAIKGFEITWAQNKNMSENTNDLDILIQIIFYGIVKR